MSNTSRPRPPLSVYDALLLPALNYAERDRLEQRLSLDEETAVIDATENSCPTPRSRSGASSPSHHRLMIRHFPGVRKRLRVLGLATNGIADELRCNARPSVDNLPIVVEITKGRMLASEVVSLVQAQGVSVVCPAESTAQPSVQDALSREEASRGVAGCANPGRALGTARACGRQHAFATGRGRDPRGLDAPRNAGVPRRTRGDSADPTSGSKQRGCQPSRSSSESAIRSLADSKDSSKSSSRHTIGRPRIRRAAGFWTTEQQHGRDAADPVQTRQFWSQWIQFARQDAPVISTRLISESTPESLYDQILGAAMS